MGDTISIDKSGRLVLPKEIRERFDLVGGGKLTVETIGDHLELRPVIEPSETKTQRNHGLLVLSETGKEFDAADAVQKEREERERQ